MSEEESVTGAVIATESGVYFIPDQELESYRVPADAAAGMREALDEEVSGFEHKVTSVSPKVVPVTWNRVNVGETGWMMMHTATRW